MDKQELQQNIALYYSKLPPKLQEMFSSQEWLETLKQLANKYNLNQEQQETLGTETTLLLLGMINLDEYQKNLINELNLPKELADKILSEINTSVIETIRPELLASFEENIKTDFEEELDERFDKLPEDMKTAITDAKYYENIYNIAQDNGLNIDQTGLLDATVTSVILGTISGDKFEEALENLLKLPKDKSINIVNAVNEKILKQIRVNMGAPAETPIPVKVVKSIVPEKLEIKGEILPPRPSATPQEGNKPKLEIHPILAQKLSNSFQIGATKTEHTLENISKPVTTPNVPQAPKAYPPKADPYRLSPEE